MVWEGQQRGLRAAIPLGLIALEKLKAFPFLLMIALSLTKVRSQVISENFSASKIMSSKV